MSKQLLTVYEAPKPQLALILAHGAGGGQKTPFMVRVAKGMATRGVTTATFDFLYIEQRRSAPDRPPVLEQRWREVLAEAKGRKEFSELPLAIGGKSMGGRIASHIAAQGVDGVSAVVFLGYPLHPPGKPEQRRDAHLPSIALPMLFVQGTRDAFGTSDEIAALMPSLQHPTLHVVTGGDHSFKITAKGRVDPLDEIMDAVASWLSARAAVRPPR
jgi:predicted alpha/beta-hydrolase family hydrolase